MIGTLIVCLLAVPAMAYALGYDRGRTAAELAARGEGADTPHEKQPTYRDAAKAEAQNRSGAILITAGPELFKRSCGRCGSRFAYRLEDTRKGILYPRVNCPSCGHEELHSA